MHHNIYIIILIIVIIIISPTITKFPEALSGGGGGGSVRIIQTWLARQPAGRPCKISTTITFVIIVIIITNIIISTIQDHFHPRHCHLGQLVCLFTGGGVFHVCTSTSTWPLCLIAINILIIITTSINIIDIINIILGQSDPLPS